MKPYESVNWNAARNQCAAEDLYYPHGFLQNALWWSLYKAEGLLQGPLRFLRRRALAETMKLIAYEDENTRFIDIGPVNKTLNMLCRWFDDPHGESFKRCGPRCNGMASVCACWPRRVEGGARAGTCRGCRTTSGWRRTA